MISRHNLSHFIKSIKIEKCWGPGDGRRLEEMKILIDQLFDEYFVSSDRG